MLHCLKMKVKLYISSSMTSEPLPPDVVPRELWLGNPSFSIRTPIPRPLARDPRRLSQGDSGMAQACSCPYLTSTTPWSGSYLRLYVYISILRSALLVCGSLAAAAAAHLVSSYLQSPPSTLIPSGASWTPSSFFTKSRQGPFLCSTYYYTECSVQFVWVAN
jgi:hypothetical protein